MIVKRPKSRGVQIMTVFKFLNFAAVSAESKAHQSNGIDRECTFQIQTSSLLSISEQGFLRISTDS